MHEEPEYDAIIIGAGFAGLGSLHELRSRGLRVRVLEAAAGVGGVWHWNRYPGARVDTVSFDYSFSFSPEIEQEWEWTERFTGQPELERYFQFVAERLDLLRDIQFNTRLTAADWDEAAGGWTLTTDAGETLTTRHLVMATGLLSAPLMPQIPGLETFEGLAVHTGQWPREGVDMAGKRVAVVGTGSSGVQIVPELAPVVDQLYVFQRTANHIVPSQNAPLAEGAMDAHRAGVVEYRARALETDDWLSLFPTPKNTADVSEEEREAEYERRWAMGGFEMLHPFQDVMGDLEANRAVADFVRRKIREIVTDPETADKLMPGEHPLGTKRISVANGYLEAFNRDNVTLLNASTDPIVRITPKGIETPAGEIELDVIVLATGYDAGTGALTRIDIRGRDGVLLRDKWATATDTYLGLATAGFPNLWSVAGHGSAAAFSNLPVFVELHARWIGDAIEYLKANGLTAIEADREQELDWVRELDEMAETTVHGHYKRTWYWGANVPGKPIQFSVYLGGTPAYRDRIVALAEAGYTPGFRLR